METLGAATLGTETLGTAKAMEKVFSCKEEAPLP